MDHSVLHTPTDISHHVATHRFATIREALAMVAILAAMIAGIYEFARGAPILVDSPVAALFATG